MKIGGNVTAEIQMFTTITNEIGEAERVWSTVQSLIGFLDLRGGDSDYKTYDTKIEDSTHIFICDYVPLSDGVKSENSRMKINGKIYDIMLIDNPMELDRHFEFYLKFTGGQ